LQYDKTAGTDVIKESKLCHFALFFASFLVLGGILFPKATVIINTHRDTILEAMDRVFVLHDKRFSDGMSVKELYENKAFKTLFPYSEK